MSINLKKKHLSSNLIQTFIVEKLIIKPNTSNFQLYRINFVITLGFLDPNFFYTFFYRNVSQFATVCEAQLRLCIQNFRLGTKLKFIVENRAFL